MSTTTDATAQTIVDLALQSINAANATNPVAPKDQDFAFMILNGMVDAGNADRLLVYNEAWQDYALTSGQQEYVVGPNGVAPFNLAVRPERIISGQLRQPTGQFTYLPMTQLTDDEWLSIPQLNTGSPTYSLSFNYSAGWPDGTLRLWPIPQSSLAIRLRIWEILTQFADLTTAFSFPVGYFEYMWTALAKRLCIPRFGYDSVPPSIAAMAAEARARIESMNMNPPEKMTPDIGAFGMRQNVGYRNLFVPAPLWVTGGRG